MGPPLGKLVCGFSAARGVLTFSFCVVLLTLYFGFDIVRRVYVEIEIYLIEYCSIRTHCYLLQTTMSRGTVAYITRPRGLNKVKLLPHVIHDNKLQSASPACCDFMHTVNDERFGNEG